MQELCGLICVLLFFITGSVCGLTISPTKPVLADALVGSSVTLNVSYSCSSQPVVMWFKGGLLVARWAIGDNSTPEIVPDHRNVLKVEQDGSLTFQDVSHRYNGTYSVEMTAVGERKVEATFCLFVYDKITNVSLHMDPGEAIEGSALFTLYYSTFQGEAKEVQWILNGVKLENGSHYSIRGKNLTINQPSRKDTGRYTVVLKNPFSSETLDRDITVLYGPDKPVLKVSPTKGVFVSGESFSLSCQAEGEPPPSTAWFFSGQSIPTSSAGTVNLTNVQTSQSGIYTCLIKNTRTQTKLERNITINIYEIPGGEPICSVHAVNENADLQFLCLWPGGTPEAQVSFPSLSNNATGKGNFSITIHDIQNLNGKEIVCKAEHPLSQTQCGVSPRGPVDFMPVISASMSEDEQTTVVIHCHAEATPDVIVHWFKDEHRLENNPKYQISNNTAQLFIHDFNASSTDLCSYTCTAFNPFGNQTRDAELLGPQISDSSVSLSEDQTEVTLVWDVPSTSVITGFDIQMNEVPSSSYNRHSVTSEFHTIQVMPASARTSNVFGLDPKSTYYFMIIPKAGRTAGEPTQQHMIGPGPGLSKAAIAGIAAGIPCGLLFLLIVLCLIFCGIRKPKPRYPVIRAVEKVAVSQNNVTNPHKLISGGLKPSPEYKVQQPVQLGPVPSVNSRVRIATTV